MSRRRIGKHISGGPSPDDAENDRNEEVRDVMARWVSGVTIVAVRDEGRVHALTVSAFVPLSLAPPTVLVSLGPNASAASYLSPGDAFGISILRADQRGLASRYADTFPAGPSPFTPEDPPLIPDSVAGLACRVDEILIRGDHRLVIAAIQDVRVGPDAPALAYWQRDYHSVG